jgi:hypothetical protein
MSAEYPGGLARVINRMNGGYGSPLIGADDDLGAMADGYELGAANDADALEGGQAYRELCRMGWNPQQAAAQVRRAFAQRARQWAMRNGWTPPAGGGGYGTVISQPQQQRRPFFRMRMGEDEVGADEEVGAEELAADEQELAAIDDEIGALEGDDEIVSGESEEALGATMTGLQTKIARLEALHSKLEARYQATPFFRPKRRKALLARMERVRKAIDKKRAKLTNKTERLAAKLGVPAAVLAAGGAGIAAAGLTRGDVVQAQNDIARGQVRNMEGFNSFWGPRHAPDALEVTLPFYNSTVPGLYLTKAAGAAGAAGAVTINTRSIAYADFELAGVDIQAVITLAQAADVPPLITVSNWGISGGFNQVYDEQPINHAGGQIANSQAGMLSYSKTLPALRQDKIELGRTNTASMTLNFNALKANGGVIDVVITASLKLRVKADDNLKRWRA